MSTDKAWEQWGKKDPYFGVLTEEQYRSDQLTEDAKASFFDSGRVHINEVLENCRTTLDAKFDPKRALDFGCGTGRLVVPLASIVNEVVGVDVSPSMLAEAKSNCTKRSLNNVHFVKSDDSLSALEGGFDFIHSFIVFQHIPTSRGLQIIGRLIEHLNSGGICALQLTYSKTRFAKNAGLEPNFLESFFKWIVKRARRTVRLMLPKPDPLMQMNSYNLNSLFFLLQSSGIKHVSLDFTDQDGELGVFLYFQKP